MTGVSGQEIFFEFDKIHQNFLKDLESDFFSIFVSEYQANFRSVVLYPRKRNVNFVKFNEIDSEWHRAMQTRDEDENYKVDNLLQDIDFRIEAQGSKGDFLSKSIGASGKPTEKDILRMQKHKFVDLRALETYNNPICLKDSYALPVDDTDTHDIETFDYNSFGKCNQFVPLLPYALVQGNDLITLMQNFSATADIWKFFSLLNWSLYFVSQEISDWMQQEVYKNFDWSIKEYPQCFGTLKVDEKYIGLENKMALVNKEEFDFKDCDEFKKALWSGPNGYKECLLGVEGSEKILGEFKSKGNLDRAEKLSLFLKNVMFYKKEVNALIKNFLNRIPMEMLKTIEDSILGKQSAKSMDSEGKDEFVSRLVAKIREDLTMPIASHVPAYANQVIDLYNSETKNKRQIFDN